MESFKTAREIEETDTYPKATPNLLYELVHVTFLSEPWVHLFLRGEGVLYVLRCRSGEDAEYLAPSLFTRFS